MLFDIGTLSDEMKVILRWSRWPSFLFFWVDPFAPSNKVTIESLTSSVCESKRVWSINYSGPRDSVAKKDMNTGKNIKMIVI